MCDENHASDSTLAAALTSRELIQARVPALAESLSTRFFSVFHSPAKKSHGLTPRNPFNQVVYSRGALALFLFVNETVRSITSPCRPHTPGMTPRLAKLTA